MMHFWEYVQAREISKRPYDKIGPYKIFLVNAKKIHDLSLPNDQFNLSATHLEMPKLVPNNEIWLAHTTEEPERTFLITNGINQYKAKEAGIRNYYAYAIKKEKAEREKVDHIKFKGEAKKVPDKVYHSYYCGIPSPKDDIEVWLVNGEIVRDLFKVDFADGGNGEVYKKWIPKQEIWVEKSLEKDDEVNITILHEYVERTLMKYKGMSYDKAHMIASKVDWKHRKKWDKEDVLALGVEEALELARKVSK